VYYYRYHDIKCAYPCDELEAPEALSAALMPQSCRNSSNPTVWW